MEELRHIAILRTFVLLLAFLADGPLVRDSVVDARETSVNRSDSGSPWVPPFGSSAKDHGWQLGVFQSVTARAPVGYYYHLPPSYDSDKDRRYPVIYWLHGLGVGPDGATPVVSRLDAAVRAGTAPAIILVSCTDPTKRSFWTDSRHGRVPVETVVVRDLVEHIDGTFRTIANRQGRAIEGHSMGGYGAAYLGFKYPDTFGAVSILAGALRSAETIAAKGGPTFRDVFGGDIRYARANSPWTLVRQNADRIRGKTFVRISVGDKDGLLARNAEFHTMLVRLGIDHTWSVVPNCTHSPEELFANWPGNPFEFYAAAFPTNAPGKSPQRETQNVRDSVYKRTSQGELKLRVHLPEGWTSQDRRPAIVFFFNSRWTGGSLEQFTPQARYFAQRGMVAALADYRVRGRHGTTAEKCIEDARSAVRWFRTNAATLGVDPDRIVAAGDSAGGCIAVCTSLLDEFDAQGEDTSVSCRANLLILLDPVLGCESLIAQFAAADVAQRASPSLHLKKDLPPTLILLGGGRGLRKTAVEFVEKSGGMGVEIQMYEAAGRTEGFFNGSPWFERTTVLMDEFLASHGFLEGKPVLDLPVGGLSMTRYAPSGK
jgi:endo-1,4-beta-xylanase